MTLFLVACGLMFSLAMMWVCAPLLKHARTGAESRSGQWSVLVLTCSFVLLLSAGFYARYSNWSWYGSQQATEQTQAADAAAADAQAQITAYQARVTANPNDNEGWLLLGQAYVAAGNFDAANYGQAANAYQHAYELTKGQDINAITGWVEALVLSDQTSLNSRAVELVDEALKLQPKHPKALWYGGLIALQSENWLLARQRFNSMLALNPPDQIKTILQQQIAALDQRLGNDVTVATGTTNAAAPTAAVSARKIAVTVTLAANLQKQLTQPMTLFVMARDTSQPGAPFAVERHTASELPLSTELTTADAMLPSRTLANTNEVDVIARLSTSGSPTEQSGDYYGTVHYSFATQGDQGSVSIEINQRAP